MNLLSFTFREMNLSQTVLWFFIYSFLGWCMECVVIRKQLGYWENRGFAKLPFCVIYGFGVLIAFNLMKPIEHNLWAVYFAGAIGATALEYMTAVIMQKLFGEVWWNYEHLRFNYKGILSLQSTLAWGFLAVFIVGFANRYLETLVMKLNINFVTVVSVVLVVAYLSDFVFHFYGELKEKGTIEAVSDKAGSLIRQFRNR